MGVKLTQEDLEKVHTKKVANVLRKLHAGKTLTAREDALLAAAGAGVGDVDATGYVGTWDELAGRLDVTRKAIQNWRSDPRYTVELEKRKHLLERADGRHCVAEWVRFMGDFQLKRGKVAAEAQDGPENDDDGGEGLIQPPRYGGNAHVWTIAKIAKDVERKGIEIDSIKGTLLEAAELEVPLGATLAAIMTKLTQYPDTAARRVKGLRDEAECRDVLRDEMDAIIVDLHAARYTDEQAVADAVAALPFDPESERLFTSVCFDGQDRGALLQLITVVATQALRQIGRRVIAQAIDTQDIPDTAIADPVTGQVTDEAAEREAPRRGVGEGTTSEAVLPTASKPLHPSEDKPSPASSNAGGPSPKSKASKVKGRRPRPQPVKGPGEVEGAIVNRRHKATPRRRK